MQVPEAENLNAVESYEEAVEFLYRLRWFGAKFGLANTRRLAELAGNPERELRFIHVAGTNGKGSTCAVLESIYRAAGWRVGLFTSPHLVSFRERMQIDREPISEAEVTRLVKRMQPWLRTFAEDQHPTFFETVTIMALCYFAEQKCDLVIWETGLGGRLDATNVVRPLASVITNIGYDHQQWLGETLESIAGEKAGIIKHGVPVITAADQPEVLKVIADTAKEKEARLIQVDPTALGLRAEHASRVRLPGSHQKVNVALALATVEALQEWVPVSETAIQKGISTLNWPGRMQLITRPSGQKILLDGAHNVPGAKVLAATLKADFASVRPALILGILGDKDWRGICEVLAPLARKILLVPVASERTAAPGELAVACRQANPEAEIQQLGSLKEALPDRIGDTFVVVTGSLYLIGEAMELLGLSSLTAHDERGLNEWGAGQALEAAKHA